ncbi:hypothetical protein G6F67_006830 [Rhizopus microsporus]|nr:hypothetical protein G6F67_006830 [Rhizopus microsporus]
MSNYGLTEAQIIELIQRHTAQTGRDKSTKYALPSEILEDLEESSSKELRTNTQKFTKEALQYDRGKWTKSGAVNNVNEICLGTSTKSGNTPGILLRRCLPLSQDKGGDGNKCQGSHITSLALGFHHQLQEEQTPTGTLRFPANMAQEGPLPTPTLEADTASVEENQSRSSAGLCNGNLNMANPILVADGVEAQQDETPSLQLEEFLSNRLEIVKRWQEKAELSQSMAQYLAQSTRKSISDNYNRHWKNWVAWCLSRTPKKDPLHYDPPLVMEYLVSLSSLSLQHLNVVRSAIVSVYRVVHAQESSLGNYALIQHFSRLGREQEAKFEGEIIGATLIARQPKEIQLKASKIRIVMNKNLCPVRTLHTFIQRTSHIRHGLENDHTLFLAHIAHDKYRARSIRPKTVSVWLEEIMKMEGIDTTRFKAHSLRSASSTKAAMTGVPIENIKLHAN